MCNLVAWLVSLVGLRPCVASAAVVSFRIQVPFVYWKSHFFWCVRGAGLARLIISGLGRASGTPSCPLARCCWQCSYDEDALLAHLNIWVGSCMFRYR